MRIAQEPRLVMWYYQQLNLRNDQVILGAFIIDIPSFRW